MATVDASAAGSEGGKQIGQPEDEEEGGAAAAADEAATSVEMLFESKGLPPWRSQITARAMVVSLVLGFFLSFIIMKLNLTTGVVPSLNVSAGLLGFFMVRMWMKLMDKVGAVSQPFTRQENTVIQTCVVACSSIAFSGGFGSYILGMSEKVAQEFDVAYNQNDIKEPSYGWIVAFLFLVSFMGLFSVVPFRKTMIINYKLTYPSGVATAHLINSIHTPEGAVTARKQVVLLFKSFIASFFWSCFQWFFTAGNDCGFTAFPTFGLQAYKNKFYFDFSLTYVGVGMICPYMINVSLFIGSVLSWGILWPYIGTKKGEWYDASLPESSLQGLNGYKIFISIAMILGDGLFHFIVILFQSSYDIYNKYYQRRPSAPKLPLPDGLPTAGAHGPRPQHSGLSFDDRRRTKTFVKDAIPTSAAAAIYALLAVLSIILLPFIIPQLRFYHIIAAYLVAPVLAFCNAYGCGLTDWSLASSYGKLAIFIFGAWVGAEDGGVLAGLAACTLMMSIVSTASDLMQDFKTGYLTLSSPRAMLVSQVAGTVMGCVIAPCVFWVFYRAFPLGEDGSEFPAPYAKVYRGIAILGTEGFEALPGKCLSLCAVFFLMAFAINGVKQVARYMEWGVERYVPSAMGMAIPFYLGSYFTIDMCVGSLVLYAWERADKAKARVYSPVLAAGLICGDGIWSLPASLLALTRVRPPICMRFLSRSDSARVDALLGG